MAIKYKLPAPDGKILLVEAKQAGQTVRTPDGLEVHVPALLELRRLEAVDDTPPAAVGWNRLQGAAFVVGALLLIAGAAAGWSIYRELPPPPQAAEVVLPEESDLSHVEGADLYRAWLQLAYVPLTNMPPAEAEMQAAARSRGLRNVAIAAAVAVVGLVVIGLAVTVMRPNRPGQ